MYTPNRPSVGEPSRRRFLHTTALTVGLAGGITATRAQSRPETLRLGAEIAGWQGRSDGIDDETNPTLALEPGTPYRIVWENLDGLGHNLALLDGDGDVLERTSVVTERGATTTLEFTASEAMAEYVCEPHLTSMRGEIRPGAGSESTSNAGTAGRTDGEESDSFVPKGATVRIETLAEDGLVTPLDFAVPPGDGDRRFVVDRTGQVFVHTTAGLRTEPFIDVRSRMVDPNGEAGLLGMVFHPDFRRNRRFYLRYSAPRREGTPENFDHTEVLAEFRASEDFSTGVLDSERTILELPSPQETHNGGAVTFGPDGYLYTSIGDGGGGGDDDLGHASDWYSPNKGGNGQDVGDNLLGSILRIDVDGRAGGKPYAIPDDNPLVGNGGRDEQFAWGFRNPWRMGFSDGTLFVGDVGEGNYEEVNIVEKGGNYGWNVREGTRCFDPASIDDPPETCPSTLPADVREGESLVDPIIEYPHQYEDQGVGKAVIGGYVYENDAIPALTGKYVFGDFLKPSGTETPTGSLFAALPTNDGEQWSLEELVVENTDSGYLDAYVLAFGRDDGELYVLTTGDPSGETAAGALHRIVPLDQARSGPTSTTVTGATSMTDSGTAADTGRTETGTGTHTAGGTTVPPTASRPTAGEGTEDVGSTNRGATEATATETTGESGPGFGVLAGLAGLAGVAARLLSTRDER